MNSGTADALGLSRAILCNGQSRFVLTVMWWCCNTWSLTRWRSL